ncbi:MAG: OmpA family protein [Bacteroidota bacterium]
MVIRRHTYPNERAHNGSILIYSVLLFMLFTGAVRSGTGVNASMKEKTNEASREANIPAVFTDDNLLLCSLRLAGTTLSNSIPTYIVGNRYYLPLQEICAQLELQLEVSPGRERISWSPVNSSETVQLLTEKNVIIFNTTSREYAPELVMTNSEDIFIESELLSQWFFWKIAVDRYEAVVNIMPYEKIPLQLRFDREARQSGMRSRSSSTSSVYRVEERPYYLFDGPSVDINTQSVMMKTYQGKYTRSHQYTTLVTGDIGYLNGFIYQNRSYPGSGPTTTFALNRADPDGGLLGPLGARSIQFGNVTLLNSPLLPSSNIANGLTITNRPKTQPAYFNQYTFRGLQQQGWDVELYRDDVLIDYRPAGPNNVYTFSDVPLYFGRNAFRLVFYGPHGERREEEEVFNIGYNLLGSGELYYTATAAENEKDKRLYGQFDMGISKFFSASMVAGYVDLPDGPHRYLGGGFSTFLSYWAFNPQFVYDVEAQQWTTDLGLQAKFSRMGLNLRTTRYTPYQISRENVMYKNGLKTKHDASIYGIRPIETRYLSDLSVRFLSMEYFQSRTHNFLDVSWSFLLPFVQLGQHLSWNMNRPHDNHLADLTWGTQSNMNFGPSNVRMQLLMNLTEPKGLNSTAMTYEYRLSQQSSASLSGEYGAMDHRGTVVASWNRYFGFMALSANASINDRKDYSVGLGLSMNITQDNRMDEVLLTDRAKAVTGSTRVRVFLDANNNKVYDKGETPVPGVSFFVNTFSRPEATEENGIALIDRLPNDEWNEIAVSQITISNPSWVPELPPIRFIPRSGVTYMIDCPLKVVAEIGGTLFRRRELAEQTLTLQRIASPIDVRFVEDGYGVPITLSGINFYVGKATLRPEAFARVDKLLNIMLQNDAASLTIAGHTDTNKIHTKEFPSNIELSQARANTIRAYLISKGIDESRITALGFGEFNPIAPNRTVEGRALNRRVEFFFGEHYTTSKIGTKTLTFTIPITCSMSGMNRTLRFEDHLDPRMVYVPGTGTVGDSVHIEPKISGDTLSWAIEGLPAVFDSYLTYQVIISKPDSAYITMFSSTSKIRITADDTTMQWTDALRTKTTAEVISFDSENPVPTDLVIGKDHSQRFSRVIDLPVAGALLKSALSPAAGITIELRNEQGEVVKKTRSSYDGYYNFPEVSYGHYTLSLSVPNKNGGSRSHDITTILVDPGSMEYIDLNLVTLLQK